MRPRQSKHRFWATGVLSALGALLATSVAAEPGMGRGLQIIEHLPSEMAVIPAGILPMGMPSSADEDVFFARLCLREFRSVGAVVCPEEGTTASVRNAPQVMISRFAMDRHEVVVAEYRECVQMGPCDSDPLLVGDQRYHQSDWPVVNVRWSDALDYCHWRGKRLPSEAEWEMAARGPAGLRYPWGNQWREGRANHGALSLSAEMAFAGSSPAGQDYDLLSEFWDGINTAATHPLPAAPGAFPKGNSEQGVSDLAGNVAEWVQDYYSSAGYKGLSNANPVRRFPAGSERGRVVRGGSWLKPGLALLSYLRNREDPSSRRKDLGFRCAKSLTTNGSTTRN